MACEPDSSGREWTAFIQDSSSGALIAIISDFEKTRSLVTVSSGELAILRVQRELGLISLDWRGLFRVGVESLEENAPRFRR